MNSSFPTTAHYRGRFAPSPTGSLHFGSLVAALGSWLRARALGGDWLVRVEDIDPPRERAGASSEILETLKVFGMQSDEPVLFQKDRHSLYRIALQRLLGSGDAFSCTCTRSDLAPSGIHQGACKGSGTAAAIRLRVPEQVWRFHDAVAGEIVQHSRSTGDFVLWRADGFPAYQLAVVVDDHAQGITEVVRGGDLLDSTPRQIYLQQRLHLPTPGYLHVPLALDAQGHKLSKSLDSLPIDRADPLPALRRALIFLGQSDHRGVTNLDQLLLRSVTSFDVACIPPMPTQIEPDDKPDAPMDRTSGA